MKPERLPDEQPHTPETDGINLLSLYRSMLRIVARLDESAWQTALESTRRDGYGEMRRIENEIRNAERTKLAIMENLRPFQRK